MHIHISQYQLISTLNQIVILSKKANSFHFFLESSIDYISTVESGLSHTDVTTLPRLKMNPANITAKLCPDPAVVEELEDHHRKSNTALIHNVNLHSNLRAQTRIRLNCPRCKTI